MIVTFFEGVPTSKITVKHGNSWKEVYDILSSNYEVVREHKENNVSEFEYETFLRNLDSRKHSYDSQRNTNAIIIHYLDLRIQIEKLI